jgi:hypothetical protein
MPPAALAEGLAACRRQIRRTGCVGRGELAGRRLPGLNRVRGAALIRPFVSQTLAAGR